MIDGITQQADGSFRYHSALPFELESGQQLQELELVYETWGKLSPQKDNVILIHHALSVGAHVASSYDAPSTGWWQDMLGPDKAIDTNQFFVICINNLGSCFGSTGPTSKDPSNGEIYNASFPRISIGDMVNSQRQLLEHLGINKLYAIIGNSMGAMLSLIWTIEYPQQVERAMLSCTAYKAYPANIANRHIQQSMIRLDPQWQSGNYTDNRQLQGFKLARKLGLFTYRNSAEWNRRFNSHEDKDNLDGEIVKYMDYNADKFAKYFDANSYLAITEAMDDYDVTRNYESNLDTFSRIAARVLVVSEDYDILFTPQQQRELFEALQQAGVDSEFISHHSKYGHDAFLVDTKRFGSYIRKLLMDESAPKTF